MVDAQQPFQARLDRALDETSREERFEKVVGVLVERLGGVVGTLHIWNREAEVFELTFECGLPDVVRGKVERIPLGKGMAGIAAERKQPVQVCNLQTDDSGVVRSGAKDTKMEGSIACPMFDTNRNVVGVIGVGKPTAYDFTDVEVKLVEDVASQLAERLS